MLSVLGEEQNPTEPQSFCCVEPSVAALHPRADARGEPSAPSSRCGSFNAPTPAPAPPRPWGAAQRVRLSCAAGRGPTCALFLGWGLCLMFTGNPLQADSDPQILHLTQTLGPLLDSEPAPAPKSSLTAPKTQSAKGTPRN